MLTDYPSLLAGGKSGPGLDILKPENSELLQRINHPISDEKHMPPEGKNQLTSTEKSILVEWILLGADPTTKLTDLALESELASLIHEMGENSAPPQWEDLPTIKNSTIEELNTNYCAIQREFNESNALSVQIFPHLTYSPEDVLKLKSIKKNIVALDLSGVPLGKKEMEFVGSCPNLEKLEIDRTPVDDQLFSKIAKLSKLKYLKAYSTDISDKSLPAFVNNQELEKVYLWDTKISKEKIVELESSKPDLQIDMGVDDNIGFTSILPVPVLKKPQSFFIDHVEVSLVHPLKGINIHYTLDGTVPSTLSTQFENDFNISTPLTLKYRAIKEGWESSPVDSVVFRQTMPPPDRYEIKYGPDPAYSGKGVNTVFDLFKGSKNFRDSTWLGFKETSFELSCAWVKRVTLKSITLSIIVVTDPHIFPPTSVTVFGGLDSLHMRPIGKTQPAMPRRPQPVYFQYIECVVDPIEIKYLKIKATPIKSMPVWHGGKGQKGWVFIDEILMSEQKDII